MHMQGKIPQERQNPNAARATRFNKYKHRMHYILILGEQQISVGYQRVLIILSGNSNYWRINCFPDGVVVKNPPANTGDERDSGSIPGSGRSPGAGSGNLLQYSCLENSMDRGGWRALKSMGLQRVGHN